MTGIWDSGGPGHNDNLRYNEDPIESELGLPQRTNYNPYHWLPNPFGMKNP